MNTIKALLGLFVPVRFRRTPPDNSPKTYWAFSMTIGGIPLGWIMVAISMGTFFVLQTIF